MKIDDESYFHISIYYAQNSWNRLIDNFISPYLLSQKKEGFLKLFNIYLGTETGDHIKIVLNYSRYNINTNKNLVRLSKKFLLENPSQKKHVSYPLDTLFLDFPNNSVWYNKQYPHIYHSGENKTLELFREELSKCFFQATSNEIIDAPLIFTFVIYILFSVVKISCPDISNAYLYIIGLKEYLNSEYMNSEITDSIVKFQNIEVLRKEIIHSNWFIDIIKDIWTSRDYNAELMWIGEWQAACKDFLGEVTIENFFSLSKLVFEQLGTPMTKQIIETILEVMLDAMHKTIIDQ